MAAGWVLASAPSEAAAIDSYWDGDEWQAVLSDAEFYSQAAGVTVESMRNSEGDFQKNFTDRDVRMVSATQTITVP